MTNPLQARLRSFQKTLKAHGIQGYLVSKKENIQYFTNIRGLHPTNRESFFLISPKDSLFYHSSFIEIPSPFPFRSQAMNAKNPLDSVLSRFYTGESLSTLGIEAQNLTVAEYSRLKKVLPQLNIIPTQSLIEQQRLLKDAAEIKRMQQAGEITACAMDWVMEFLKHDRKQKLTELQLVRMLENKLFDLGATSLAFPVIVAFNTNASQPHHIPSNSQLTPDSIVLIDMGCQKDGYASDMTRTFCLSPTPPADFQLIESIVLSAYAQAEAKARAKKVLAKDVDMEARKVITDAGYGEQFIHTTGHGLGLEIHEQPSINSQNDFPLTSSMAFTIEPGIYLPGKFGYRHENTLIKKSEELIITTRA